MKSQIEVAQLNFLRDQVINHLEYNTQTKKFLRIMAHFGPDSTTKLVATPDFHLGIYYS